MGTAEIQGELWNQAPKGWAMIQEPMHRPLWEAMLDGAMVGSGVRILDAGCGGGGASLLAAERGAEVSGIDAADGLILITRDRIPSGDFRVGDIEDLSFGKATFDVVFAANSLQYSADRLLTLREFRRVCRPDGRIVAGLFGPPENVAFSIIQTAVRDALPEPPAGAGPYELSLPGILEGLFEQIGLKVLNSSEIDCPFSYPDIETFWKAQLSAGPFQKAMRATGKKKLKAAVYNAVEPFRLDDGSILIRPNIFKYVIATL